MELWVDTREQKMIESFSSLSGITVKVKTLYAGDYAIVLNDVIVMLFERKSWADLLSTWMDHEGRKLNYHKMLEQREKFGCKVMYLIEENKRYHKDNEPVNKKIGITYGTLRAHLNHLMIDYDIHIVYSHSREETPAQILKFMTDFSTSKKMATITGGKFSASIEQSKHSTQPVERVKSKLLRCIKGVSKEIAEIFITKKIKLKDIFEGNFEIDEIASLERASGKRIGDALARKILMNVTEIDKMKFFTEIPQITENNVEPLLKIEIESLFGLSVDKLKEITGNLKMAKNLAKYLLEENI